jgi:hypothetical protein
MAITMVELFDSREMEVAIGRNSVELRYGLFGSFDDVEVDLHVAENIPDTFANLPLQRHRISPQGAGVWFVTATYSSDEVREVGEDVVSFNTVGGTVHITQSIATKYAGKADGVTGDPPDFKGAIGVAGDRVEGLDVAAGNGAFSITHYFDNNDVTNEFITKLAKLKPFVNNAPFRGFSAGEVLFLGAAMSRRGDREWEVTFSFQISENVDDYVLQGCETPFSKDGHDYIWFIYQDDTSNAHFIKKMKFFYVEQVYDRGDFAQLEIPQ